MILWLSIGVGLTLLVGLCVASLYANREIIRGMWDAEMESVKEHKARRNG
jgi:heme exporter protein D